MQHHIEICKLKKWRCSNYLCPLCFCNIRDRGSIYNFDRR